MMKSPLFLALLAVLTASAVGKPTIMTLAKDPVKDDIDDEAPVQPRILSEAELKEGKMHSKLVLIIIEALVVPAVLGCDRCYMGNSNGWIKGLTLGGLGVWFAVDYMCVMMNGITGDDAMPALFASDGTWIDNNFFVWLVSIIASFGEFILPIAGIAVFCVTLGSKWIRQKMNGEAGGSTAANPEPYAKLEEEKPKDEAPTA